MELLALGVSHKTAPVAVRERLAFTDLEARRFTADLVGQAVDEAVIISTCNRTELYVVSADPV
jgi:glutamyl-tRNA reductase